MSTHPEKTTPARRWMKPLLVALPLLMILTFFFTACQFTELDMSFIPKNAIISRNRYFKKESYVNAPFTLIEITRAVWKTDYRRNVSRFTAEIKSKGYHQWEPDIKMNLVYVFRNENADVVVLEPYWDPNRPETPETFENIDGVSVSLTYNEKRPVQEKIKRFMLWLKKL